MRCGIYCRLSREDDEKRGEESESIQNQRSLLVNYAAQQGWEIYDLYCDEDYSGADAGRPDFNRLLEDARLGRIQVVLCKSQSRFTRDMELVERYLHGKFPLWGVRFVAIADHVDTAVKGNKKARQISGLVNEWYLEDLSENVRMVLDHKRRQGEYIGGNPLYGYQLDPANHKRLVVDPTAAEVVRQIFSWRLEGRGSRAIAGLLNGAGVDNPAAHRRRRQGQPPEDGECRWNRVTVSRILHNEMYTGTMVQGRKRKVSYKSRRCVSVPAGEWFRVEGTHQAIIPADTFQMVQGLMAPRVRSDGSGKIHPLAGLVFCADCGGVMVKNSNGKQGERRREYLRCRHSLPEDGRCGSHSIRLDLLLELIWGRLRELLAACPMGEALARQEVPPRELLVLTIQRVEVGARDPETGKQPVHVRWKL